VRQQKWILYETIIGARVKGALRIDAPFLTFADVLQCTREIVTPISGDHGAISPNTVQGWMKSRIEVQAGRPTRNRLYSGLDLIRIASLYYLSRTSAVDIKIAVAMVDHAVGELTRDAERFIAVDDLLEFRPGDYIVARPDKTPRKFTVAVGIPDANYFHKLLSVQGYAAVFNFGLLVRFALPILEMKWDEKARWLLGEIDRQIAKKERKR